MSDYKKGMTLTDAAGMAIAFVLFVIIVSIGGSILTGVQTAQLAANGSGVYNVATVASNATGYGLTGITNLSQQSGTIGLVLGAAVLIGIVASAFYFKNQ
jgi:hypothetical protein